MLYCSNCCAVSKKKICPSCGTKDLREVKETDLIFLLQRSEKESLQIEELLNKDAIPFETKEVPEGKLFFVAYADLERSVESLKSVSSLAMSPSQRAFWKALSIVLFLVLVGIVVIGTDSILNWVKSLFG